MSEQPSPPPVTRIVVPLSAVQLRAARRRTLLVRFGIFVGLPTILAVVYYLAFATSQFDSNMTLAVESNEGRVMAEGKGKDSNAGNQRDARLLREYLRSHEALAALEASVGFRKFYQGDVADWLTRLASDAGDETVYDYFRIKVTTQSEATTNLVTVRARAFSPAVAHTIATQLVEIGKQWLDQETERARGERMASAQASIIRARDRLVAATKAMQLVLGDAASPSPAQRTDPAVIEHDLADRSLELELTGLQQTELELDRAQRSLMVVDGPGLADTRAYPRPLWSITTVFFCTLVLVSVLSLLGAAVREHANF